MSLRSTPVIEHRPISSLKRHKSHARRHSKAQVRQIAESIKQFGFTNPVLISEADEILAGQGRVEAARLLDYSTVPTIRLAHLDEAQRRAYMLADNKLALNAGWDMEILSIEFQELSDLKIDLQVTGFSQIEIDKTIDWARRSNPKDRTGPADVIVPPPKTAVSRSGDVWLLGRHRLVCGDAQEEEDYVRALDSRKADLIFTDPPYNVKIDGHVCGLGAIRHREFAMASGEMSEEEFTVFLTKSLRIAASRCRNGTIAFVFMDWRHMAQLLAAGKEVFKELKNICVWNKTNAGMGTFYRSKHEMVCAFKIGDAPHTNNFGLGVPGRCRSNVWDYPGISSPTADRQESLEMHPTVKPTKLVIDAIEDCTKRGQLVLDPFAGSGTTLIAAEMCGRTACVMEYDAGYCDTIVQRYERHTGKYGKLEDGSTFEAVAELRQIKIDDGDDGGYEEEGEEESE